MKESETEWIDGTLVSAVGDIRQDAYDFLFLSYLLLSALGGKKVDFIPAVCEALAQTYGKTKQNKKTGL